MRGVQIGPGAIAFTLMPLSMRCVAKPFVKLVMAPCTHRYMLQQKVTSLLMKAKRCAAEAEVEVF